MSRYANKRMHIRTGGGQFRKATMQDVGIGGVCACGHFLLSTYDGDPRDPNPDPRKFRARCFTCEPVTDAEQVIADAIEAARPRPVSILDILKVSQP